MSFHVLLVLLAALTTVHHGYAMRIHKSRAEVLSFLSGREVRLYFSECEQLSNTASCVYAMDASLSREHSQCAQTVLQIEPYWLGILEHPAYVTKVTVLNVDHTYLSYPDGLLKLHVFVNDEDCFPMETKISFDKRTFPCDAVGDTIVIKATAVDAVVLTICDVEVVGVPLQFLTMEGSDQLLPTAQCSMNAPISGSCADIQDNSTISCAVAGAPSAQEYPYFAIKLQVPSIINEVQVPSSSIDNIQVTVQRQACTRRPSSMSFHCKNFGDTIIVSLQGSGTAMTQLSVCEFSALGHESDLREPTQYAYMGCHSENPADRDLPQLVSATRLTVDKCYRVCKRYGFKFFGLHNYRFCYCGFTFGKHGKLESNFGCEKPCDGDGKLQCGSEITNSIYEILS